MANRFLFMQAMASRFLKANGSKCTLTKPDGTTKTTFGVILSVDNTDADGNDGFVTGNQRLCYLEGKTSLPPSPGDTVKFGEHVYAVFDVKGYAADDIAKNVLCYKLAIGV